MSYLSDLLRKLEEAVEERLHHDRAEAQEPAAGNTVSNRSREVRYYRRASPEACAFCQMLALRPYAQYHSEKAALFNNDGEPYHPGCDCEAIEVPPGETYPLPAYTEQWKADYDAARDDLDQPGDVASVEDILNHMRRAQYARDHPDEEQPEEPPTRRAASIMADVITKSVDAQVTPIESENPNGEFEVILSTETLDRDGENLWMEEWKTPLPKRIHIDSDHGRSVEKTVGSAVPRIEGNRMIGAGTYASTPHAQMVRQLVNDGHITSLSVTYTEQKNQKSDRPQRELLNAAFVAVPANPDAVVLSSKAAKDDDGKKPYGDVSYADPGYQSDNRKRYPIDTADHVRAAWSYINQASNAGQYSAEDLKKVKGRIRAAASKFGVEIAEAKKSVFELLMKALGDGEGMRHDDAVQAIHDAAVHLGGQCTNETQADTGEDEGANKSFYDKSSSLLTLVGSPQGSAEESAATDTAAPAAVSAAADKSADDVATQAWTLRGRSLAFQLNHTSEE